MTRAVVYLMFGCLALTTSSFNVAECARAGDLLVANFFGSDSVLRYDGTTGAYKGIFASGGGLSNPYGLAFGLHGNLLVSSFGSNEILEFDSSTGEFVRIFATDGGLFTPGHMTFGPDNNLYVSNINNHSISRFDGATGEFIDIFIPPNSGGLYYPSRPVFGPDGNGDGQDDLYVGIINSYKMLRFDGITGDYIDDFISGPLASLDSPHDFIFHADGLLYIAQFQRDNVVRYDLSGDFVDVFASGGGLENPVSLRFGTDGRLYVGGAQFSNNVVRYDGTTGAFIDEFVAAGSGGLYIAADMLFLPEVPEPPSLVLLGLFGLAFLSLGARRRVSFRARPHLFAACGVCLLHVGVCAGDVVAVNAPDQKTIEQEQAKLKRRVEQLLKRGKGDFYVVALLETEYHQWVTRTYRQVDPDGFSRKVTEFKMTGRHPVPEMEVRVVEGPDTLVKMITDYLAPMIRIPSTRAELRTLLRSANPPGIPTREWKVLGRFANRNRAESVRLAALTAFQSQPHWELAGDKKLPQWYPNPKALPKEPAAAKVENQEGRRGRMRGRDGEF